MLELASLKVTLHHNVKAGIVGSVANVCFTPIILDKFEQVKSKIIDVSNFFALSELKMLFVLFENYSSKILLIVLNSKHI